MDLLRHLDLFEAVADHEHFGRAAEAVGMAQPPMSQAIRRLETELGCRLFERTAHGAVLTPAGHRVREAARRLAEDAEDVRAAATTAATARILWVDPAAPEALCLDLQEAIVAAGIPCRIQERSSSAALEAIRSEGGTALVMAPFRSQGLRCSTLARCRLWQSVPASDATGAPSASSAVALVHPDPPAPAVRVLQDDLRAHGMTGRLRTCSRREAAGDLRSGRIGRVLSVGHPRWHPRLAARIDVSPMPLDQVAVVVQLVTRRDDRDATVHAMVEAAHDVLADAAERDDL